MTEIENLDEHVTLEGQLSAAIDGPIEFVEIVTVPRDALDGFEGQWAEIAAIMKRQPGFISAQLRRGIAGSATYMNIAVWDKLQYFKAALQNPEFKAKVAQSKVTVERPHIYRKVAVPGICIA